MAAHRAPSLARPGAGRIAAAAGAIVLGLIGTALSYSLQATRAAPQRALAAWPWNAAAAGEAASQAVTTDQSAAAVARAREVAARALASQPIVVAAARALGLAASVRGDSAGADRAMAYAETLSRRDVPTELWQIEDRVGRGDIAGALRHYDHALRVSDTAPDLLFPVLIAAAADPAVAGPLASTLAARPLWWQPFLTRLIQQDPSDTAVARIVRAMRLDPRVESERALLSAAMTRLADAGRADLAAALAPPGSVAGTLRNGGFDRAPGLAPFDWMLKDEGDLGGFIEPRDGGSDALFLSAQNGRGGEVARQLLRLAPGRYRLSGIAGDIASTADAPMVTIVCTGSGDALAQARAAAADPAGRGFATDFAVPVGCAGQWLAIQAAAPIDAPADRRAWIDSLAITRR